VTCLTGIELVGGADHVRVFLLNVGELSRPERVSIGAEFLSARAAPDRAASVCRDSKITARPSEQGRQAGFARPPEETDAVQPPENVESPPREQEKLAAGR
jgi:hypothetical protein